MKLNEYVEKILGSVLSPQGLKEVKECIKKDMKSQGFNYDNTKVENSVLDEEFTYEPKIKVLYELYSDCQILFVDYEINYPNE